ncbi:SET domain-containing protein [Haematococcus lacustris]|uniref:SET domain-containing protein n=1 Tax=Haematococcus lacustris TaxID=44745 RepID=A0A6A0ABJ6_HAELA|nr:SET domain-containing protein [Haematococcus lacustris]
MEVDAGRFLAAAAAAKAAAASDPGQRYNQLLELQGTAGPVELRLATQLLPLLGKLRAVELGLWSALYGLASLINHECNPNVARFDNFDAPGQQNTLMVFKAMHDLPVGTEVLQSYCPIGWDYADRQAHCREVYGFTCSCQRCLLEASWDDGEAAPTSDMQAESDEQWETTEGSETELGPGDVDMADVQQSCPASQPGASALQPDKQALQQAATQGVHQQPGAAHQAVALHSGAGDRAAALRPVGPAPAGSEAEGGPLEATYLQLYLLKFVCPRPHCLGTMAPTDVGSSLMTCAVCGCQRSEQAFLADLDAVSHK